MNGETYATQPPLEENHPPKAVLIVDDEESIRLLLKEYCEIMGLEVYLAGSGFEGWSLYTGQSFGLVLCDVSMPGMDGFEFYEKISEINPHQKFIFISGYAFASKRKALMQRSLGLLQKPFYLHDLNQQLVKVYPDIV
jgi:two-component system, NtrC family, nitrogen regulation response regulator NtrX